MVASRGLCFHVYIYRSCCCYITVTRQPLFIYSPVIVRPVRQIKHPVIILYCINNHLNTAVHRLAYMKVSQKVPRQM